MQRISEQRIRISLLVSLLFTSGGLVSAQSTATDSSASELLAGNAYNIDQNDLLYGT
jgi:hypothetical protein